MKAALMNAHTSLEIVLGDRQEPPGLVVAASEVLAQGLGLLELTSEKYSVLVVIPFQASVGQHYRHVLEHFQCLLQGSQNGEVNYDSRQRNPRIEKETAYANAATREVLHQIEIWTENKLQQRCTTTTSIAYHSEAPSTIPSNLGRELAYCIGHAIHHYAIIRLLCSHLGAQVPPEFGFAPSTLKYQRAAD